jgi:hypothetical protein
VRRWHVHWGTTPGKVRAAMPGDALVQNAHYEATRAVTMAAPTYEVWRWLVQVGCLRAGWYSNDLVGRPRPSECSGHHSRVPADQDRSVSSDGSDTVDEDSVQGRALVPNESLLWRQPDSTWAEVLVPIAGTQTRLLTRLKIRYGWDRPFATTFTIALNELGD